MSQRQLVTRVLGPADGFCIPRELQLLLAAISQPVSVSRTNKTRSRLALTAMETFAIASCVSGHRIRAASTRGPTEVTLEIPYQISPHRRFYTQ
jgi:hypothetical protein